MSWKKPAVKWAAIFIGLGIVAFAGVRAGRTFVTSKRSLQLQLTARDTISEQLRGIVGNLAVLRMATRYNEPFPGNDHLTACLSPEGLCTVTSPEMQMQFVLKNAVSEDGKILAGTSGYPGVYSINGKINCDRLEDVGCPGWNSYIWFWADCPDAQETCEQAERIWVRYQVAPVETYRELPSLPPQALFEKSPGGFAYSIQVPGN